MNTTTTGELLSLLLLHAVKQVSIKIFWWHQRTTESSVVCLLLCYAFCPSVHICFMIWRVPVPGCWMGNQMRTNAPFAVSCINLVSAVSVCGVTISTIQCVTLYIPSVLMWWFIEFRSRLWLFIISRIIFFMIWCIQRYIWGPVYEDSVCTAMFHTRGADDPDWWKKIFRFYVLHSRELNFSLCHMVCPSARDTQANEEASKYPSRKSSQKASLGSSLSVISSLERRRILDGPYASDLTILLRKQCAPWVWRKLATSSLAGLQSWLKVTAAAQRHRVTVQINRAILKA